MFPFPLTFHVRFFAREVAHHGLQLTQLTVCWVDVGLAVGPARRRGVQPRSHGQKRINLASPVTELTIRWLLSGLNPAGRGDLGVKKKEVKQTSEEERA